MRDNLIELLRSIQPCDSLEEEQINATRSWIASGAPLYRLAKPDLPPQHLVAYFALFDPVQQQLLLVDHKKSGLWLPSGGHVEPDEQPQRTVQREALEELRIEASFLYPNPLFLTVTQTVGHGAKHTDVSLWYLLQGDCSQTLWFDANEFHQIAWFALDELPLERCDPHLARFVASTQYPSEAPGWQDFGIRKEAFWDELEKIEPFSVSAGLRCFYRMYAARFGKKRWGEKTPSYGLHMLAIEQLLPEAHFIHIIRDGRDVALSLRNLWFSPSRDMRKLAEYWRWHVLMARKQGKYCRNYLQIHYEELVLNLPAVLKKLCAFCDLTYDSRMEEYYVNAPQRLQEAQARVRADGTIQVSHEQRVMNQQRTMSPPDPSRISAWRSGMSRAEQKEFEKVAGHLLLELGYDMS